MTDTTTEAVARLASRLNNCADTMRRFKAGVMDAHELDQNANTLRALAAERDTLADRIEELDDIIRHDRERIEELVSMVNSKDARIEELEDKLANIAHTIWTEHKDWEGERKYALRQIVKWMIAQAETDKCSAFGARHIP